MPTDITTDQETQFESPPLSELMKFLGNKLIRTSPYHLQANGLVKRFHRVLKAVLKSSNDPINWVKELPLVLLGIRHLRKFEISC